MAKQKLGMGTIEINKKFGSEEQARRYAKNLQGFIYSTCKKNEDKGYEAQAIIGVSNIHGQAVVKEINKRNNKPGRPKKEKQFVSEDSYYGKTTHTDWHIHILIVSKPSYTFRNLIKKYIDKRWVDIENLYEVKEFDLSKLNEIKSIGGEAYKKTTNIGTLFYIGKQSVKPLYCNYPKNNELKYSLKQLYNEKVKLDTELLNNKDYQHGVDGVKEKVESKYLEMLNYYYSITKEQDKKNKISLIKKRSIITLLKIIEIVIKFRNLIIGEIFHHLYFKGIVVVLNIITDVI